MAKRNFRRIVLKLSGEALAGEQGFGINPDVVEEFAKEIAALAKSTDLEIAIVVGGGNLWRGLAGSNQGMDRATADYMGMLATVMNSLALQDALEQAGVDTRVQTAIEMQEIAEPYIRRRAIRHLEKKRIVIFGAGLGKPYFSTDTTAALRAAEIEADAILMAKKFADGVYDSDPKTNPNAVKFDELTYNDIITKELKVMDATSTTLCKDNNIPIIVFSMDIPGNITKAAMGEEIGTIVRKELLQQAEERMNKSIEALKHEFASIRTGRASVALLDKVMVDYYGSPSPINQVANISVPEPRMIVIAPWDKTMIGAIEKAILQSDLGLNPGNDGAQIRLTIPQLTEERRKEIVKVVHKKAEDAKVAVRNIRRDVNDALKKEEKAKTITEDDAKDGLDQIQKLTDAKIKQIDELKAVKEKDVLEV